MLVASLERLSTIWPKLKKELSEKGSRLVYIAREVFCLTKAISNKQIAALYFLRRIRKLKKRAI
jgi:hypothetical protein